MRVLFVSKSVAPPYHDGTLCLVRDVAAHLVGTSAVVMSAPGAPPLAPHVELAPVYADHGSFAPSRAANLRAAAWLARAPRCDAWHFVFAPNLASSRAGRALSRWHRVPVVQTVASAPRDFVRVQDLLFGDVVVAQSEWTRRRISIAYEREAVLARARRPVVVVPPPVGPIAVRDPRRVQELVRRLGVPEGAKLYVYPGDLETSQGAHTVARAVEPLVAAVPEAFVAIAYRAKTPRAARIARDLASRLAGRRALVVGELDDVLELVSAATAVLFPVEDLSGKVDHPIVLLEAMQLGVPIVTLDYGPLSEITGAVQVPHGDLDALVAAAARLATDGPWAREVAGRQRAAVLERWSAPRVALAYERLYAQVAR